MGFGRVESGKHSVLTFVKTKSIDASTVCRENPVRQGKQGWRGRLKVGLGEPLKKH